MLTVSVNKANTESNLKSEELENIQRRLDHLNSEIISTRSLLEDLESVKDDNLNLKKSLMTLENEKKVKYNNIFFKCNKTIIINKIRISINLLLIMTICLISLHRIGTIN